MHKKQSKADWRKKSLHILVICQTSHFCSYVATSQRVKEPKDLLLFSALSAPLSLRASPHSQTQTTNPVFQSLARTLLLFLDKDDCLSLSLSPSFFLDWILLPLHSSTVHVHTWVRASYIFKFCRRRGEGFWGPPDACIVQRWNYIYCWTVYCTCVHNSCQGKVLPKYVQCTARHKYPYTNREPY